MEILNQIVIHKALINSKGEGTVISQNEKNVTVKFGAEEISYPFPSAFEKFLKFKDKEVQEKIDVIISEYKELEITWRYL